MEPLSGAERGEFLVLTTLDGVRDGHRMACK